LKIPPLINDLQPDYLVRESAIPLTQWNDVFSALFEKNPMPMFIADPFTSAVLDLNDAATRLFNDDRLGLLGESVNKLCGVLISPEILRTQKVFAGRFPRPDGGFVHLKIECSEFPLKGRLVWLVILTDVSAQKSVEAAYSEVQRKYQSLFENSVEGFYINVPAGRFVEVNPAFAKMLGYESPAQLVEEIQDIATQLYVNPAQRKVLQDLLVRRGYVRAVEFQAKRRDGNVIWLSVSARQVLDAQGDVLYYEGLAEDVSERKNAEAKLREMNRALANHMAQLERSNTDLEQFAHAVSHDLKEPLRLISSYLTLLSIRHQPAMDLEAKEFLAIAVENSKKMKGLIEDLLAYATIGSSEFPDESVNTLDVVEEVLEGLKTEILKAGAVVTVGQLPTIQAVRSHLCEFFRQVLENALKFRKQDGPCQITVSAARKDDHWLFEIRDTGIGMDPRLLTKVFHIFFRAHSKLEYDGNGIGLAIAKKIVELHGGRIWLSSSPGEGSSFFFTLPLDAH
jgi:PAS domain S-box-containing protein